MRARIIEGSDQFIVSAVRSEAADEIRSALEASIQSGTLPLGAPLDLEALAHQFGASRSQVLLAVSQLRAIGLVLEEGLGRFSVGDVATKLSEPHLEVLIALQCQAARMAARRLSQSQRELLMEATDCFSAISSAALEPLYAELDSSFHGLIIAGSCNVALFERIQALLNKVPRSFHPGGRQADLGLSCQEHEVISAAIIAGEPEKAASALRAHLVREASVIAKSMGISLQLSALDVV